MSLERTPEERAADIGAAIKRYNALVTFIEALGYDPSGVTVVHVAPPLITVTEKEADGTKVTRDHLFLVPARLRNTGEVVA